MKILITTLIILTIPVFGNGQISITPTLTPTLTISVKDYDTKNLDKDLVLIGADPQKAEGIKKAFNNEEQCIDIKKCSKGLMRGGENDQAIEYIRILNQELTNVKIINIQDLTLEKYNKLLQQKAEIKIKK